MIMDLPKKKVMIMVGFLDSIFVPFGLFLMLAYHVYLWYCLKKKPFRTTIGANVRSRFIWFLEIMEDVDKNGMLAVQSLRNIQMVTILNASFSIILNTALAALTNNSYKASHLLNNTIFSGSNSGQIFVLKYGFASFLLLLSFFCSSIALAFFMDANFLINALSSEFSSFEHSKIVLERASLFALIGNRLLLLSFPILLWAFGPLLVVLSSVALIWRLYGIDFVGQHTIRSPKKCHN